VLEPLPLGPVNSKHDIIKNLMWNMGFYSGIFGWHLSHISHPHLEKGIAIPT
jgi:hypothetical protein